MLALICMQGLHLLLARIDTTYYYNSQQRIIGVERKDTCTRAL